ncbi:MAG: prepilin-type N-terminal cleavage/methylation domain-containing protein [bacterium]|nr:prepilin-type N-terminal cleavage/methylation domain-containing protein [bacterium]
MQKQLKKIKKLLLQIHRDESGFSLMEIMVATMLASLIFLTANSAYRLVFQSVSLNAGVAEFYQNVNLATTKMDKDISNVFYNRKNKKVNFIGDTEGENSVLNFVSTEHKDFNVMGDIKKAYPKSDIREIGYYLKEDKQTQSLYSLIRREESHYDDDPVAGGEENVILDNVVSLRFEFMQGRDWTDRWDSRDTKRFPKAVKTTLVVKTYNQRNQDGEIKEEQFIFLSRLNMKK